MTRFPRYAVAVARGALVGALAAATAIGLLSSAACSAAKDPAVRTYPQGDRAAAPDLRGDLLGGGSYDLAAHRGEVIVINFWASWCAPCRDEAAELAAVYAATRAERVSFLGVNVRDERDKAQAFLTGHHLDYPSLYDPAGQYALAFKVPPNTIPATLVVDRQGRLAAVYRQAILREDLEPAIRRIANEDA